MNPSLRRQSEAREHSREADEIEAAVAAAGGIGDSTEAEKIEERAALQQAAHGDGEKTGTIGR